MAISRNARSLTDFPEFAQQLGMVSLRQVSFGKEKETRTLKPFVETLRVRIPPGKAGPAARSESCVVVGRPILRSFEVALFSTCVGSQRGASSFLRIWAKWW